MILVLEYVLLLGWLLPLSWCYWSWYHVAPRFALLDAPARSFMQVTENGHRRFCDICEVFKDNRTVHSSEFGKCIPMYDHFCGFMQGGVWAHNFKAYLLFVLLIPVHGLFCVVVSAWTLSQPQYRLILGCQIVALVLIGLVFFVSAIFAYFLWKQFLGRNVLYTEECAPIRYYKFESSDMIIRRDVSKPTENPWNLGLRGNFAQYFGPWYKTLLFWVPSPVVDGNHPVRADLTSLVPARPIALDEARWNRRRHAATTGFEGHEDLENSTVVRRQAAHTF
ncbi:hypothetical protein K491DRAFT_723727 [Lophiostoma macrostomum CBS 122681]|uniref:Palmitoyltransferase n=1 Tax=Lophiostoma macrostomum CBS 122681 TaxID=1314788 RepID=A0A6A6SH38_9PLEO|nr:hypothetical protein K491DRAFT_723727 [Lophiostoma macrostomum CBS 122681]